MRYLPLLPRRARQWCRKCTACLFYITMTLRCYTIFADAFGQADSAEGCIDTVNYRLDFRSARRNFKPTFPDCVSAVQDLK